MDTTLKNIARQLAGLVFASAVSWFGIWATTDGEPSCENRLMEPGDVCRFNKKTLTYDEMKADDRETYRQGVTILFIVFPVVAAIIVGRELYRGRRDGAAQLPGAGYPDWAQSMHQPAAPPQPPPAQPPVPGVAPQRGIDALVQVFLSLTECAQGAITTITVDTAVACDPCASTGLLPGSGGTCTRCGGDGRVRHRRDITARIPAGVGAGTRIRLPGQGEGGLRGGPPADLYLQIVEQPHPVFIRQGNDLHTMINLTPQQAVHGTTLSVQTLLDGPTTVNLAPGIPPDWTTTLPGLGMPDTTGRRGNLHIRTRVSTPT